MEYIEGKPLSQSNLSIRQFLFVVKEIAWAMDHAHKNNVIHRDLKPANIIIKKDCTPSVVDFGIAKNFNENSLTQTGTILGTPRYMAPEQAKEGKKQISAKTDIYALGIILYEFLAGTKAIKGETPA